MSAGRVLVVSGTGLTVHHRHGAKLLEPFSFDADAEGVTQFSRYLDRFPNDITRIIADVVEEEFREETIPHLLGRERRAMLRTRAERAFRGARYVHATTLGRESGGRRDDRVLLSAITRPEVLVRWLVPMARHAVPLAGIYSPAMLTGAVLEAIESDGEHVLVVSHQAGGGLRQTCLRRGRVRLSRLAAIAAHSGGEYGSEVLAEVEGTRRYLNSLGTAPDDGRPEVRLLSHGEPLEDIRRALRGDAGRSLATGCTAVDLADVARRLGMRRWGGESAADRLFVHVLARRPPSSHYATSDETRGFATLRVRAVMKIASAGLVAGGCVFGGGALLEGVIAGDVAHALATQAVLYEGRYREAQARLPASPAEPVELERVVSAVHALRARRADPVDLLVLVSNALAGFPQVRIESVSWRTSDDAQAPVGRDAAPQAAESADSDPAGETRQRDPNVRFHLALVGARIDPFEGDYRAAIDTVRRFAGALAASPGVEHVRVLSLPLDLSSERTLTGDTETAADTAAFEIRVAVRTAGSDEAQAGTGAQD